MKWLLAIALSLAAVILIGASIVWITGILFSGRIAQLRDQMLASQGDAAPATPELPELVRSYAVRAGGRIGAVLAFHARHEATLATTPDRPPMDIEAEQWTGMVTPGIVWKAAGSMNGLPVTVFDAYVSGRGELSARLLGVFHVAGGSGADYDKAEFIRYLSELPVYPDAILNAAGLKWRQIDERTVEVTGMSASGTARFVFDGSGDIVAIEADDRPMAGADGKVVPTPWRGVYGEYRQFGRYRIPSYGEVGWLLPDGLFTYWRGRVVAYEPLS